MTRSQSDPSYTGPVSPRIFLIEEFGDNAVHSGSFDNVTITAAEVPEPGCLALLSFGEVRVDCAAANFEIVKNSYPCGELMGRVSFRFAARLDGKAEKVTFI